MVFGCFFGKYIKGIDELGFCFNKFVVMFWYNKEILLSVIEVYLKIVEENGLSLV